MTEAPTQRDVVEHVAALFEPLASALDEEYIGEAISQLAHALQCAAWAEKHEAPAEVIVACLFHDVGHLVDDDAPQMDGLGVVDHETIGGNFLRRHGLPERVAKLVEAHVGAKRYLCCRKPAYYDRLSRASKGTLEWQGGPMNEDEAAAFADPQLAHRGFFEELTSEATGTHKYPGLIFKAKNTPNKLRRPSPNLGQDNEYVYRELLGYDATAYEELIESGAVGADYPPGVVPWMTDQPQSD